VVYGLATEHDMVAMFGFIGGLSSAMSLMNSGGIKFGEGARDRRARKEDEAFKKRQKAKTEEYLGDVAARAREREEQERLRKLLE
jgi:hypothetical protein